MNSDFRPRLKGNKRIAYDYINKQERRILVIGDIHAPFTCVRLLILRYQAVGLNPTTKFLESIGIGLKELYMIVYSMYMEKVVLPVPNLRTI